MNKFLSGMLSEHSGKISLTRCLSAAWVFGILFCVIFLTIKNKAFPDIKAEAFYSIIGVLGAKAYQRGREEFEKPKV